MKAGCYAFWKSTWIQVWEYVNCGVNEDGMNEKSYMVMAEQSEGYS